MFICVSYLIASAPPMQSQSKSKVFSSVLPHLIRPRTPLQPITLNSPHSPSSSPPSPYPSYPSPYPSSSPSTPTNNTPPSLADKHLHEYLKHHVTNVEAYHKVNEMFVYMESGNEYVNWVFVMILTFVAVLQSIITCLWKVFLFFFLLCSVWFLALLLPW